MEIGHILNELWRRRIWVAVGFLVAGLAAASTMYKLPSLERKSLTLGAASTEILVDSPRSPLGSLNSDVTTLVSRADIYARLIGSNPVKSRISEQLGVPSWAIATVGPQPRVDQQKGRETSAEERGNELLAEGNAYRLEATPGLEIPVITIFSQARNGQEAMRLADAAALALSDYVQEIQANQAIAPIAQVQIKQLGRAQGGTVNQGVDYTAAGMAFVGAFGFWCFLVLFGSNALASWRQARNREVVDRGEAPLDWDSAADELRRTRVPA